MITAVQDVLGEHQDAVVAAWLRANALTLGDPAAVFVAGELGAVERARLRTQPEPSSPRRGSGPGPSGCDRGCEWLRAARASSVPRGA